MTIAPEPADNPTDATHKAEKAPPDVYVVETSEGFTETFDLRTVETLERLGLIRHVRDGHVAQDGSGRGLGPLHRFYWGGLE